MSSAAFAQGRDLVDLAAELIRQDKGVVAQLTFESDVVVSQIANTNYGHIRITRPDGSVLVARGDQLIAIGYHKDG